MARRRWHRRQQEALSSDIQQMNNRRNFLKSVSSVLAAPLAVNSKFWSEQHSAQRREAWSEQHSAQRCEPQELYCSYGKYITVPRDLLEDTPIDLVSCLAEKFRRG